jgi:glucose-6-phosphate 1-dehydrogenase
VLGDHHDHLTGTTTLFQMDVENPDDYLKLREHIGGGDEDQVLFYLSVPPQSAANIIEHLGRAGLNTNRHKLLLEKPFGTDLLSAQSMIDHTAKHFDEEQVYRIDHYLAKEMAQNVVMFRAKNAIFRHLWSNKYIEKIDVIALESIDIEGRADFYEQTGALRDLVQGHLMQLLALTLCDVPDELNWDELPGYRLKALESVLPANVAKCYHAQYEGYRQEAGSPDSNVETFVALQLESTDENWQGVPLTLTTGKALNAKKTEVRVHFKRTHEAQSNCLVFQIQPNEGISIDLLTKKTGYEREAEHQYLSYIYPQDTRLPEAYEQVLVDAVTGRKSLFATSGEVLRSWEILAPVQEAWQSRMDIQTYPKGSHAKDIPREQ